MLIWRTLRPVDHAFIQGIIGDVAMLTETLVDWIFLRTAAEFWDPEHAVFNFQATELAPTIEEYTVLIQRPTPTTHGIFVSNPFTTVQGQLSTLLHIPAQDFHEELHQRAIAQVVLQAVGGHSYVEALLAETVRSHDYVREVRRGKMRGSPHLLQIWLLAHIHPFCSSHPFSYIADERSLIERVVPVIPPPEHSFSEWRRFWQLRAIREERDRLRCELVDSRVEVANYREVQTELTRARARVAHLDREMARLSAQLDRRLRMAEGDHVDIPEEVNPSVPTISPPPQTHASPPLIPAGVLPVYSSALPTHLPPPASSGAPPPPASPTSAATNDEARIAALEGTVNQMTTNMAELLALLRGPNRASPSSTPPPGPGPTVDPTPWAPLTQAPENVEAPAPPMLYTSTVHPFTSQLPPPPAPLVVPLPPATFLSSVHILSAPPPVSIPAPAMINTTPPPTVFPATTAPALNCGLDGHDRRYKHKIWVHSIPRDDSEATKETVLSPGWVCQHPILAHRLPAQGFPTEARDTIHHPAIGGK
ncbi:hypothetical protein CRG98_038167 [Punica granatum]|uniref:DUF7745 domain-containing protein n=1 Tax=Punica granatum TaxID=22663 RepID=A0A2I0ICA9_PUNGR|nr:hypothetical protein CRG98_038167 [Punica granatum]